MKMTYTRECKFLTWFIFTILFLFMSYITNYIHIGPRKNILGRLNLTAKFKTRFVGKVPSFDAKSSKAPLSRRSSTLSNAPMFFPHPRVQQNSTTAFWPRERSAWVILSKLLGFIIHTHTPLPGTYRLTCLAFFYSQIYKFGTSLFCVAIPAPACNLDLVPPSSRLPVSLLQSLLPRLNSTPSTTTNPSCQESLLPSPSSSPKRSEESALQQTLPGHPVSLTLKPEMPIYPAPKPT